MNPTYTKPADQAHKIQVQSNLIYVLWTCGIAHAETEAPFIVKTSLVGEGAEIKIKLKTDSGKTLEKKSDKIFGNCYRGTIAIPLKVKMDDMLYLEIELPKQGLSGESNQIPAGPVIQVRSMNWSQNEVKRGDVVKMQAEFIDLPEKTVATVTIYEYDQDGNIVPVVNIPTEINNNKLELLWEYQYYEDTGKIPSQSDLQPYNKNYRHPEYYFVIEIDGTRIGEKQESGLLKFKDWVEYEVVDEASKIMPNEQYVLDFADNSQRKGSTDASGILREKEMPPGRIVMSFPNKPGYEIVLEEDHNG